MLLIAIIYARRKEERLSVYKVKYTPEFGRENQVIGASRCDAFLAVNLFVSGFYFLTVHLYSDSECFLIF